MEERDERENEGKECSTWAVSMVKHQKISSIIDFTKCLNMRKTSHMFMGGYFFKYPPEHDPPVLLVPLSCKLGYLLFAFQATFC